MDIALAKVTIKPRLARLGDEMRWSGSVYAVALLALDVSPWLSLAFRCSKVLMDNNILTCGGEGTGGLMGKGGWKNRP